MPDEIVFTSGASESNNLAIKGTACALRDRGNHLITAVTEHKSVLDTFKRLAGEGFDVTWLPVDSEGFIDLDELRAVDNRQDRAGLGDGGKQRDRHRAASRGDRRDRQPSAE